MICLRDELKGVERYTPTNDPSETVWFFKLSPDGYEAVRALVAETILALYRKWYVLDSYVPAMGDIEDEWAWLDAGTFGLPINVKDGMLEIVAYNDIDEWPDTQHPDFMGPEPDVDELNSDQWIDVLAVFKAIQDRISSQGLVKSSWIEDGLEMDPGAGEAFGCPPALWGEA